MARPLIGITTDHDRDPTRYQLMHTYVNAVRRAGGEPIALPYHEDADVVRLLSLVDGLLMTGGNDPDPSTWCEAWHPSCVPVDPRREAFEYRLLDESHARRTPTLGICLGMQLMGLRGGGALHQFLPDVPRDGAIEHRKLQESDWQRRHAVQAVAGSRFSEITGGDELAVNTNHRQALRSAGAGLVVSGHAPDGVIEAIEDPTLPMWVGVQWHPERLTDDPAQLALFQALVEAAGAAG
ncbi:MAG: gamma-glutamyl-gamma-aminobutyrate hydrolase family protein [Planctomycetota bacterium]